MTWLLFAQGVVVAVSVWLAYWAGLRRGRGEGALMMRMFLTAALRMGVLDLERIDRIGEEAFKVETNK